MPIRPSPTRRRHPAGQAMIEIALVFIVFVTSLVAVIDVSLWGVESNAATNAAEEGVRIAAGSMPTAPSKPNLPAVAGAVSAKLRDATFGTPIRVTTLPAGGSCPTPDQVYASAGNAPALDVCSVALGPPLKGYVEVRISGYVGMLTPPGLGIFWSRGTPIDVTAITHQLTYSL